MLCFRNAHKGTKFLDPSSQTRCNLILFPHFSLVRWSEFEHSWTGWHWSHLDRASVNTLLCRFRFEGSVCVNGVGLKRRWMFVVFGHAPADRSSAESKAAFYGPLSHLLRIVSNGCCGYYWRFENPKWLFNGKEMAFWRSIISYWRSDRQQRLFHWRLFWSQTAPGGH